MSAGNQDPRQPAYPQTAHPNRKGNVSEGGRSPSMLLLTIA
ncbi:MAG: hypothetical protein AAGA67_02300 [Cyanobacteria bacterium P01_F01_bin.153]